MDQNLIVHVARLGEEFDQLAASEIPERMAETWIVHDDLYWHQGMANWETVGSRWSELGELDRT